MAPAPATAGHRRRTESMSAEVRLHGSAGATAIMNNRAKPIGMVIRSKYGLPTEIRFP